MATSDKENFLYFAYGSNLLKSRILINNPSSEFIGIGRLDNHQLDFIKYSDHWRGTSATIVPTDGSYVWGAIWRLHKRDLHALDKQEDVHTNWYFAKTVNVVTPDGSIVTCRTYQQSINPEIKEELPPERRHSITYLDCIIKGAKQCQLPLNYRLDFIKYFKFWGGPTATVVPTANGHVWGVIWRLDNDDLGTLDDLKLQVKKYFIKYLKVLTPYMGEFIVRAYIQKINPLPRGENDPIPAEQWPSRTYKKVIILGAIEHRLPDYYIDGLEQLKDNGKEGCLRLAILLRGYEKGLVCECFEPHLPPEVIYRKPLKLDLNKLRQLKIEEEEKEKIAK